MRTLICLILFAFPPRSAQADDINAFVAAGIGLPELVRLEVGYFVHDRVSVQAVVGFPLLAPMGGFGISGWLLGESKPGRPPTHTLLASATARVRLDDPLRIESGGDSVGAAGEVLAGYGLLLEGGFVLRVQGGVFLYEDSGFAVAPQAVVTAGYAF